MRRAGAAGEILLRADSGFWNKKVIARLREQGCRYSIGVTMHKVVTARIALIPDQAWQPVDDYPDTGVCELAEMTLGEDRLIVRRVHLHAQDDQTELFTYWRHFAFVTNRSEPMHHVDAEHRQHAQVELVIRDLKDQALAHFPSAHPHSSAPDRRPDEPKRPPPASPPPAPVHAAQTAASAAYAHHHDAPPTPQTVAPGRRRPEPAPPSPKRPPRRSLPETNGGSRLSAPPLRRRASVEGTGALAAARRALSDHDCESAEDRCADLRLSG